MQQMLIWVIRKMKKMYFNKKENRVGLRNIRLFFVSTLIMILMAGLFTISVSAASDTTISLGDTSGTKAPGEQFTVPVTLPDDLGFVAGSLDIIYDKNNIDLVSIDTSGSMLGQGNVTYDFSQRPSVGFLGTVNGNSTNGVLFKINFRVKDAAQTGQYSYSAQLKDGQVENLVDSSLTPISATFQGGSIQVNAPSSGSNDPGPNPPTPINPPSPTNPTNPGGNTTTPPSNTTGGGNTGGSNRPSNQGTASPTTPATTTPQAPSDAVTVTPGGTGQGQSNIPSGGTQNGNSQGNTIPENQVPLTPAQDEGFDWASLPWPIIIVLLAVIFGGLIFLLRNRRREEEENL